MSCWFLPRTGGTRPTRGPGRRSRTTTAAVRGLARRSERDRPVVSLVFGGGTSGSSGLAHPGEKRRTSGAAAAGWGSSWANPLSPLHPYLEPGLKNRGPGCGCQAPAGNQSRRTTRGKKGSGSMTGACVGDPRRVNRPDPGCPLRTMTKRHKPRSALSGVRSPPPEPPTAALPHWTNGLRDVRRALAPHWSRLIPPQGLEPASRSALINGKTGRLPCSAGNAAVARTALNRPKLRGRYPLDSGH